MATRLEISVGAFFWKNELNAIQILLQTDVVLDLQSVRIYSQYHTNYYYPSGGECTLDSASSPSRRINVQQWVKTKRGKKKQLCSSCDSTSTALEVLFPGEDKKKLNLAVNFL